MTARADRDDDTRDDFDIVCFSHLRWNFVWQRPQHLLERWARERRAFFVEEPVLGTGPRLDVRIDSGVHVVVPHLPEGLDAVEVAAPAEACCRSRAQAGKVAAPDPLPVAPSGLTVAVEIAVAHTSGERA